MKRILVVDENEMLCRLSCDILRGEGYHTAFATSVAQALEAFEQQEFDLVVTDCLMPGMGGLDLAREIRARQSKFPIIVMTAYEPLECEHVTLWLPKNFLFPHLLEKVRACLAETDAHTVRA
ncbi:MAG TPA: response regulator [Terriglobales bacterium]|nr:response regulator [Terriglobales bacterium]